MKALKKVKENFLVVIFLVFIFAMSVDYCISAVNIAITEGETVEKTEYKEEFFELKRKLANEDSTIANNETSFANDILDFYKEKTNALSNFNDLESKDFFINLNAELCKGVGMSYIPGTTFFKYEDGTLVTLSKNYEFDRENLDLNIGFIKSFVQSLEKKGINFAYVNCPNKERLLGDELPLGFVNYKENNENQYMIEALSKNDIPLLDLTEKMVKTKEDAQKMFYKTDHHWKTENGIHSARYISEFLNLEYDYNINTGIFEMSNYDVESYEKCLLGSTGINSTASFVAPEDFNIYVPKFEHEFFFEIPSKKVDLEGDFGIFINREKIDNKKEWPFNAYASYIYANSAYIKIENKSIEDDHKVLIIKDSFANAIVPYLAQVIKRVDVVDLRIGQTDHFNDDIMELIEENNYDTVLFVYSDFSYEFDRLFLK